MSKILNRDERNSTFIFEEDDDNNFIEEMTAFEESGDLFDSEDEEENEYSDFSNFYSDDNESDNEIDDANDFFGSYEKDTVNDYNSEETISDSENTNEMIDKENNTECYSEEKQEESIEEKNDEIIKYEDSVRSDTPSAEIENGNLENLFMEIPIENIVLSKENPFVHKNENGEDIDDVVSLANDIKENGLIHPITVVNVNENTWRVVSGERRLKAYKFLRYDKIPAYIRTFNNEIDEQLAVFAANFATRIYSPVERLSLIATYYKKLLYAYTDNVNASIVAREKISALLSVSSSQVQKYITISKKFDIIPESTLKKYDSGELTLTELYKLVANSRNKENKNNNIDKSIKQDSGNSSEISNMNNNPSESVYEDTNTNDNANDNATDSESYNEDYLEKQAVNNNENVEVANTDNDNDSKNLNSNDNKTEIKDNKIDTNTASNSDGIYIARKKSNVNAVVTGNLLVSNDRYFIITKVCEIDAVDVNSDRYNVNATIIEVNKDSIRYKN